MFSVTKINLFSMAVTPINKSNSSFCGLPSLFKRTFSSAYFLINPKIGIITILFKKISTALCDLT
jgi:hypothetical protein